MLNIIIPVYNEKDNIVKLLEEIKNNITVPITLYIVYDFDEDNTIEAVNKVKDLYNFSINLVKNNYGAGVLNAIKTGLYIENTNPALVVMSDLSDSLEIVDDMYKKISDYDVVCGSRYMKGGKQIGGPFIKGIMSKCAGISLHFLTGINTHDVTNSFKMYSRNLLNNITIESNGGFELGMEITVKAHCLGYKITEIPSTWKDRVEGKSRFKLFSWLPKYLHWYFYAFRNNKKVNKMRNYLEVELFGFNDNDNNKLLLNNNSNFKVKHRLVEEIFISNDIKFIKIFFKKGIFYEDYKNEIKYFLYSICFNMILNDYIHFCIPFYRVVSYTIKNNNKNTNATRFNDYIGFGEELKIFTTIDAYDIYQNVIKKNNDINIKNNFVKYEIIFKILHNNNSVVVFLSLYQYLMDLVEELYLKKRKKFDKQESVKRYLKSKGEKIDNVRCIKGKKVLEDKYTHIRNRISHSTSSNDIDLYMNAIESINESVIKGIVGIINDLIIEIGK